MNLFFLEKTPLFNNMAQEDISRLLQSISAVSVRYKKGEYIYRSGQTITSIGMVLSGNVIIDSEDLWGNTSVIGFIGPGEIFAETYAEIPGEPMLVNAAAGADSQVLFINAEKLLDYHGNDRDIYDKVIRNLLSISARKSLNLSRRILYTSSKTIRGRLTMFLSDLAKHSDDCKVCVPFNRQQLADYLGVDRSAMCSELSKMQRDGLIKYRKNTFEIIVPRHESL